MDTNKKYKVKITPTAFKELDNIYNYIAFELYAENSAHNLMEKIENKIQSLKENPKLYTEIDKIDELKRIYRRAIVNNYVILYTIDEIGKVVFVSHIYYGKQDYSD